jgi:hypothetical protein
MSPIGQVIEYRDGTQWRVVTVTRTSDGFILGNAVLLDEDGDEAQDESGFPIVHSFFFGR